MTQVSENQVSGSTVGIALPSKICSFGSREGESEGFFTPAFALFIVQIMLKIREVRLLDRRPPRQYHSPSFFGALNQ